MIKFKTNKSSLTGRTSVAFSSLALSTALLLGTTVPLYATDFTVANGDTLSNTTVTLATGETGTIEAGGKIEDNATHAITATGNVTVDNAGTIVTTSGGNDGVHHTTSGMLTLFNRATGTITGVSDGVQGDVLTLTNWGTIEGNYGVGASTLLTSLVNFGTITGTNNDGVGADAITSLINSGTITGVANAVFADGTLASLINSGTITGGDDGVEAITITKLTNTGKIVGTAGDGLNTTDIKSLTNSGTITGGDEGVFAGAEITSLTNSGTIKGGDFGVLAAQITSLINTGTIIGANRGVGANGDLTSLINTGTITGTADDGIFVVKLTSLINSGTITGADDAVWSNTIASLTNSGKITGGNHAIIETTTPTDTLLTLLPGSDISGKIDLGAGTNTLAVGNGLSTDLTFVALPQVINSNGAPVVANGTRVVTVDTTALAQQDNMIGDLSSGIWGTVMKQLSNSARGNTTLSAPLLSSAEVSPSSSSIETAFGDNSGDSIYDDKFRMWADAFGSYSHQASNGTSASANHMLGGFVIGLDSRLDSTTTLGAFFGASITDIVTVANQQESDVNSFFAGLYGAYDIDNLNIRLGITAGRTVHKGTRLVDNNQINGIETASRTFDGTFLAPEIALSSTYDIGGTTFQPTLSIGYTGVFLDGYTETGISAPLTIANRDMHLLHARLEMAALLDLSDESRDVAFSPYAGIQGSSLIDGETVNATLLGQNLSFTPGGAENIASLFAGARLSVMQTESFNIFAGVEASYDTEQSATIAGNLGFKWQF